MGGEWSDLTRPEGSLSRGVRLKKAKIADGAGLKVVKTGSGASHKEVKIHVTEQD